MCVVSNIGDHYRRSIPETFPWWDPTKIVMPQDAPSKEEFEKLKKEVQKMKRELDAAKKQDIAEGNPDCEMEEKVEILKQIAKLVGIDLGNVFDHLDKKKVGQNRS